ncbi:MAG: hypothetical protein IKN63_06840 [Bacilli bacterium]|nr:hypothetical protein [Bacilli bacterium]
MGWLFGSGSGFNAGRSSEYFYKYFAGKCASCEYFDINNRTSSSVLFGEKYKCTKRGSSVSWRENTCSRLKELSPSVVDCYQRYIKLTRYYILTAICDILGIDENNRIYQEISALISTVREDETTIKEATLYNTYGPELADMLRSDSDKVSICEFLLENYLTKVCINIGFNKINEAINDYQDMVEYLYLRYKNIDNYAELIDSKGFENPKVLVK